MSGDNFGWGLPPGITEAMIPGCRPQDEEYDRNVTLSRGEMDELANAGTIPEEMIQLIYDQLMYGWKEHTDADSDHHIR